MDSTVFLIAAIVGIVMLCFLLFLALFEPGLAYKISSPTTEPIDTEDFLSVLEAITDSKVHRRGRVEVLANGENYYEAELEAIRAAEHSIHIEAYIFQKSEIAGKFVEALTERARATQLRHHLEQTRAARSLARGLFNTRRDASRFQHSSRHSLHRATSSGAQTRKSRDSD